jgi:hypothetical protein
MVAVQFELLSDMTDETLSSFIDRANELPGPEIVFTRPLTANVYLARAWRAAPDPTDKVWPIDYGYGLYLIQNPAQRFVAAVLDMGEDLHWLVQPSFRGQGYLTQALRSVILPHLLQNREQQRITISRGLGTEAFLASEKVARTAGFELLEASPIESIFIHKALSIEPIIFFEGVNQPLARGRMQALRQQFTYHAACLRQMKAEIELSLGNSFFTDCLDDLAAEVHNQKDQLEKHWAAAQPDTYQ